MKSKGLSDEKVNSITTSSYAITPSLDYLGVKTRQNYLLSWKNSKHFHCYEINKNFDISGDPALENCLFGAVSLTKNVDIDLYKYSGYGNRFDRKGNFSFGNGFGRNCIFFAVDMSSSVHIDNKKRYFNSW